MTTIAMLDLLFLTYMHLKPNSAVQNNLSPGVEHSIERSLQATNKQTQLHSCKHVYLHKSACPYSLTRPKLLKLCLKRNILYLVTSKVVKVSVICMAIKAFVQSYLSRRTQWQHLRRSRTKGEIDVTSPYTTLGNSQLWCITLIVNITSI